MRKILIGCCFFLTTFFLAYGQENPENKLETTITVTIEGMACQEGCADTINEKLKQLDGIHNSMVSFESGKAILTYDPQKSSLEEIKKAIETTKVKSYSYTVTNVKTQD